MKWSEFRMLLSGLAPNTPLGRIVSIRAEDDKDVLKYFSREQHRIRNEWNWRRAEEVSPKELADTLEQLKQAFISMAGGMKK